MAKKKIQSKSTKTKKKRWYQIIAPKEFNEAPLGETSVVAPEDAFGKPLKTSLMNITNDMKKQNINVSFRVTGLQGSNLATEITGYEMIPAAIKRLVRRRRDRLDESFMCYTADKKLVRIKPFTLTRSRTTSSVLSDLRENMVRKVVLAVQRTKYEKLFMLLISHKLQNEIKSALDKIHPMKNFEIRQLFLAKENARGRIVEIEDKGEVKESVVGEEKKSKKDQSEEESDVEAEEESENISDEESEESEDSEETDEKVEESEEEMPEEKQEESSKEEGDSDSEDKKSGSE